MRSRGVHPGQGDDHVNPVGLGPGCRVRYPAPHYPPCPENPALNCSCAANADHIAEDSDDVFLQETAGGRLCADSPRSEMAPDPGAPRACSPARSRNYPSLRGRPRTAVCQRDLERDGGEEGQEGRGRSRRQGRRDGATTPASNTPATTAPEVGKAAESKPLLRCTGQSRHIAKAFDPARAPPKDAAPSTAPPKD